MPLEDLFSRENFLSYGRAIVNIAVDMPEVEFDTLLIPGRGAVPILNGSLFALKFLGKYDKSYSELLNKFRIPKTIKKDILSKSLENIVGDYNGKDNGKNILFCPSTADINMKKFDKDANNDEYIDNTRAYWTRFIGSLHDKPEKRKENEYFQFQMFIFGDDLEKRKEVVDELKNHPRIKKLAMIDTAISGRAASTVLKEFEKIGIEPYTFLVVDKNGERLKQPYKRYLKNLGYEYSNKLEMYGMKDIISEDKGAALLGVTSVVYPSLMLMAKKLKLKKRKFHPVGAGSWQPFPIPDKFKTSFNTFINAVNASIAYTCTDYFGSINKEREMRIYNDLLERERSKLVNFLKKEKLLQVNPDNNIALKEFYEKHNYKKPEIHETRSHVLHIGFSVEITRYLLNIFKRGFDRINQNIINSYKK